MTASAQPLDVAPIQAREQAATPLPWHFDGDSIRGGNSGRQIAGMYDFSRYHRKREDADFIAHARQDVPDLIAEVLRLRELLDQRTGDIADRALENAALRSRLDAVHDTCDDIEAEVNGATSDDTTYGGHITRIRNAAGFRTSP